MSEEWCDSLELACCPWLRSLEGIQNTPVLGQSSKSQESAESCGKSWKRGASALIADESWKIAGNLGLYLERGAELRRPGVKPRATHHFHATKKEQCKWCRFKQIAGSPKYRLKSEPHLLQKKLGELILQSDKLSAKIGQS